MPFFQAEDGLNLHFTDTGTGIPVLALAGLTRNARDFDHVAPHLPVRLICLDYRGRGKSDWGPSETYSIPHEAKDAVALLDHLGITRAAILGTSRGGLIAMILAATQKERLLGVALNDIGPEIPTSALDAIKAYVGISPAQKTLREAAQFRANAWTHFLDVPMERWLTEVTNQFDETPDGLVLKYDPKLRDAVLNNEMNVPDLWPAFDLFEGLPLALVRGVNSDLITKPCADEMSRRRPDMIRADVPGRGHVPFLDEPEALAALHEWLEKMR